MPNYLITIRLKIGKPKQGIRWSSSYDPVYVRGIVEKKVFQTLGKANIDQIDVVPTARKTGERMDVKPLVP